MSAADAIAADAATTNWRTYDGPVPGKFIFYVVLFPLLMFTLLALPTLACYCCLGSGKGKIAQYFPPNRRGRGFQGHRSTYQGTIEHGYHPEKF